MSFIATLIFVYFLMCSYCENGSMRCSSPEMNSFLSDLFYDEDLAPSRGAVPVFRQKIFFKCPMIHVLTLKLKTCIVLKPTEPVKIH